jgi:hypothetical protein
MTLVRRNSSDIAAWQKSRGLSAIVIGRSITGETLTSGIGVDLPVLVEGDASNEECHMNSDPGEADDDEGSLNAELVSLQAFLHRVSTLSTLSSVLTTTLP